MKKIILLLTVILFAFNFYVAAQKSKLTGHWLITKMITAETGNKTFEINPAFFEKLILNSFDERIKQRGISPDSINLKAKDSLVKEAALNIYNQFKGVYVQFNSNNTYAASLSASNLLKGNFIENKKQKSIIMSGDLEDTFFYTFKKDVLHLRSEDGQMEAYLIKRKE